MTRATRIAGWVAALALLLGTASVSLAQTLTIALAGEPAQMDEQWNDDGNMRAVTDNVYETLVSLNADTNKIEPLLATSWEQVDPTTWRFHLRHGVTFQDGEPFNADAAVFSVNRFVDPKFGTEMGIYLKSLLGGHATKVDDYTFDIHLKAPDPVFIKRLPWLVMVPPEYVKQNPDGLKTHPVGTGPYKFIKWDKGQDVVLQRYSDYWGPKPQIAEVRYIFRPEAAVRLAALKTGEAQLAAEFPVALASQAPKVFSVPGTETVMLKLNTNLGITKDVRVRQAINYAIDRKAIISAIYKGHASMPHGQGYNRLTFGFDPNIQDYPYDPAKAKQLLQEAGAVGKQLTYVYTSQRWANGKEVNQAVGNMLQKVGLDVKLEDLDFDTYLRTLRRAPGLTPEIMYVQHGNEVMDAAVTDETYYASKGEDSTCNLGPQFDSMISQAGKELDLQKRQQLYFQIGQEAQNQACFAFVVRPQLVWGATKNLNWSPRPDARYFVKTMTLTSN